MALACWWDGSHEPAPAPWGHARLLWGQLEACRGGRGCCGVTTCPAMVWGSMLPGGLTPTVTRGSGRQHQHHAGSGSPAEASVANGVKSWENSLGLIAKGLTRSFEDVHPEPAWPPECSCSLPWPCRRADAGRSHHGHGGGSVPQPAPPAHPHLQRQLGPRGRWEDCGRARRAGQEGLLQGGHQSKLSAGLGDLTGTRTPCSPPLCLLAARDGAASAPSSSGPLATAGSTTTTATATATPTASTPWRWAASWRAAGGPGTARAAPPSSPPPTAAGPRARCRS